MVTAEQVYKLLPKANVKNILTVANQSTSDIINQVLAQHKTNTIQAKKIAHLFDGGNAYSTCKNIWTFLKYEIPYKVEPSEKQTTKTLSRIVYDALNGKGNDCKHYSGFTGAILDALGYKFKYRFAGYSKYHKYPTHVYCICDDSAPHIIIDAVLNGFDIEKPYQLKIDKNMSLYKLSGVNSMHQKKYYNQQMGGFFDDVWDGIKNGAKAVGEGFSNAATWVSKEGKELVNTVVDGGKTATLTIPRNAFLGLVAINFRGYANTLSKASWDELVWWRDWFGGDRSKLRDAINTGKTKSRILGIEQDDILIDAYIGEPITATVISGWVSAAAGIILSIQTILSNLEKKQDAQTTQQNLQAVQNIADSSKTFIPENKDKTKPPTKTGKFLEKGKQFVKTGTEIYSKGQKIVEKAEKKGSQVLDSYNQAKITAESYGADAAKIINLESTVLTEENKKFLQTLKNNFKEKYGVSIEDVLWKKGTDNTTSKKLSASDFKNILPKDAKKLVDSLATRAGIKLPETTKKAPMNNYILLAGAGILLGSLIYKGKK